MGNKKASESLEEGILGSNLGLNKIPCNKFLMEPTAPLCSLNENNAACVYGCRHFKELRTCNGGFEESSLIDITVDNGKISGGKICICPSDDVEGTEIPLEFGRNIEIKVVNIDESLQKNDGLLDSQKDLQFEETMDIDVTVDNGEISRGETCTCPGYDVEFTDIPLGFGRNVEIKVENVNESLQKNDGLLDSQKDLQFEETMDIDVTVDNGEISGGETCTCPGDDVEFTDIPVGFGRNVEIKVENVNESLQKNDGLSDSQKDLQFEEPMDEAFDVMYPTGLSSLTNIDVSGDCINLFVDVSGPLDGISDSSVRMNDEIETVPPDIKIVSTKNDWEDRFGEQNGMYHEGDLVWTKTRTQIWWPGMVSDPFSSANDATKSEKKGNLLVKYFGNANFTWCGPSEVKPFLEHFEQMSDQNSSRNFCGSVEKALSIIGCRIKAEMTCPCFSKENRTLVAKRSTEFTETCPVSVYRKGKVDVLSAPQFQPSTFLALIRDLARSAREPGKAELTVTKNRLAAFYCSVGHHELPVQLLRSSADSEKDTLNVVRSKLLKERRNDISETCVSLVAREVKVSRKQKKNHAAADALALDSRTSSSGKGFESRERKKSKYLSHPYVNVKQKTAPDSEQKTEELNHGSSLATKSAPLDSSSGNSSSKNGAGIAFKGIFSEADNIDVCATELLGELCRTACEWSHLSRSKYSDSLKRFYVSFRIFSFANADIVCNDAGPLLSSSSRHRLPQNKTKAEVQIGVEVVKESENEQGNLASVNYNADCAVTKELPKTKNLVAEGRKKAKKKEPDISASVKSVINSSSTDKDVDPNSIKQTCSDVPKSEPDAQEVPLKLSQINLTAQVPDLNANHPAVTIERSPAGVTSISSNETLPEHRNDNFVSPSVNCVNQINLGSVTTMPDARLALHNKSPSQNGMFGSSRYSDINFGTGCSDVKMTGFGSFFQQSIAKLEQRKRRTMEKASEVASGIPDLNGTASDKTSAGLPGHDSASPECKQQDKKRAPSDPGGSLLLSFAPGCTLPPKETLVTTFSRFGLLKESEIQILDECTVQIPYERSTEARFAFRSLEKRKPFGEAIASFKLQCESAAPRPVKKRRSTLQVQQHFWPVNLAKPVEAPDLTFMKQNVEMMKSTLEKAGDSISREMRAKLENEIKVFLDRISPVPDSSS